MLELSRKNIGKREKVTQGYSQCEQGFSVLAQTAGRDTANLSQAILLPYDAWLRHQKI